MVDWGKGKHKEKVKPRLFASAPLQGGTLIVEKILDKGFIEQLKKEWKTLWRERVDDRFRAEAIANRDYDLLFVERGTVIFATRKFKLLNLKEILQMHGVLDADRFIPPNPQVGGWGKFIRTVIANQPSKRGRRAQQYVEDEKQRQQLKKGGRGWLHIV